MKAELGDAGNRHVLTTSVDFFMDAYFLRRAAAPFLELNIRQRKSELVVLIFTDLLVEDIQKNTIQDRAPYISFYVMILLFLLT